MTPPADPEFLRRRIAQLAAEAEGDRERPPGYHPVQDEMPPDLQRLLDDARISTVSDPITRGELDAKLGQAKAEGETQFEKLRGELAVVSATLTAIRNGQLGLAGLIVAALGIAVAVMAYGGQWFGLGLQSHDAMVAAAREGAVQALAARH